ncbi:TGF-beta-activated kinase 1 and MAP3K7-binding protein 1-like [Paramacrobiotus metropolitanus]|uniref:TGF-beta-activated kinase 1 and MAP3K7-binding protein 1-like n=1 Tax=Paramacrobiotus metropolitanus TaxID=2943436 RepID=UPI002445EE11|nr:TGF-beta-activated kinase 1 and MAP3K7-binding protein 1-like [Paramacrobiotus metropolitanus]
MRFRTELLVPPMHTAVADGRQMRDMDGRSVIDIKWSEEAGVGCTRKCLYRGDGAHFTMEDGVDEDRVISYRVNDIHLYSIFDGHDGSKASQFAAQQFPLELLLGQLEGPIDDEEVRNVVSNAFLMVEEKFFDSLEESASPPYNATGPFSPKTRPGKNDTVVPNPMAGGTTAVMAIYCHGKLYFAHCGDTVAVLCYLKPNGELTARTVGIQHNIDSDDEALRLSLLGLDVNELKQRQPLKLTRCIGNYALKKQYQTFDILRPAVNSPIICDPEIIGGLPINANYRGFIYLMSSGLYKSWYECSGSENVEEDIAKMIATQLCSDKSLHDVAQAVLEEVCSRHAAAYAAGKDFFRREEMTLLIRNFGLDRSDVQPSTPPPRIASDLGFPSAALFNPGLRRSASEQLTETVETDADSLSPPILRPAELDAEGFEYIDPYVDFAELASVDTDFEWTDSDE